MQLYPTPAQIMNPSPTAISDSHSHAIRKDGKKHVWLAKRLWQLAQALPVFDYPVAEFSGFELDCWFGDRHQPTINAVLAHMQRVQQADMQYPIIVSADGLVMDGIHRLCRAKLEGWPTVKAVRFINNPPPDRIEALPA